LPFHSICGFFSRHVTAVDHQHLAVELHRPRLDLLARRLEPVLDFRCPPQQAAQAFLIAEISRPHRALRKQHHSLGLVAARNREQAIQPEAVGHGAVFVLAVAARGRQIVVVPGRQIDGGVQHLADFPVRVLGITAKARTGRQARERDLLEPERFRLAVQQLAQPVQAFDGVGAVERIAAAGPVAAGQRHHDRPPGLLDHVAPLLVQPVAAALLLALDPVQDHEGERLLGRVVQRFLQARVAVLGDAVPDHREPVRVFVHLVLLVLGAGKRRQGKKDGERAGEREGQALLRHQAARRFSS
jgi:hypothetical protein